jgi:hypothetical protein
VPSMTGVRDPRRATPASHRAQAVTSRDGTPIAFDRIGDGPAVILVGGATMARQGNGALAEVLANELTVLNHDRRGRGASGDTPPYAVQREIEDIDALIAAAGGSELACVAGPGRGRADARLRRGVPGHRAAARRPSRDDQRRDPGVDRRTRWRA